MANEFVKKDTLIGEIVRDYPESADVLFGIGMHCLGCPASRMETFEQACMVHGVNPDEMLERINTQLGLE